MDISRLASGYQAGEVLCLKCILNALAVELREIAQKICRRIVVKRVTSM